MTIRWALNITLRGQAIFTSGEGGRSCAFRIWAGHGRAGNSTADMRPGEGGGAGVRGADGRKQEVELTGSKQRQTAGWRGVQVERGETTFPLLPFLMRIRLCLENKASPQKSTGEEKNPWAHVPYRC